MPDMPSIDQFNVDQLESLRNCPLCTSENASHLFDERGWSYWQCRKCTLIYLNPRLREEYIGLIYDDDTYHTATNRAYTRRLGEKQLNLLRKFGVDLGPESKVFEDGAGMGAFVAACVAEGIDASGSDLGHDAIDKAKQLFDVDLHLGTLDSAGVPEGTLDVLVGFNLLSHLYEPWTYADRAHRLLKPGGYWFVRTGDRSGIMKRVGGGRWSAPEHIFHFTKRSLVAIAGTHGFDLVRTVPAFDSSFPNLLAAYSRSGTRPTHRIATKVHSYSYLAWTLLGLPKEDRYFLFQKRTPVAAS